MNSHLLDMEWHEYACIGCETPYAPLLFLPVYAAKQPVPRFARDILLPLADRLGKHFRFLSTLDQEAYDAALELHAPPRGPHMRRIMWGLRTLDWLVREAYLAFPTRGTLLLAGGVLGATLLGSAYTPVALPLGAYTAFFFFTLGEQAVRKNPRRMLRVLERLTPDMSALWVKVSMQEADAYVFSAVSE